MHLGMYVPYKVQMTKLFRRYRILRTNRIVSDWLDWVVDARHSKLRRHDADALKLCDYNITTGMVHYFKNRYDCFRRA